MVSIQHRSGVNLIPYGVTLYTVVIGNDNDVFSSTTNGVATLLTTNVVSLYTEALKIYLDVCWSYISGHKPHATLELFSFFSRNEANLLFIIYLLTSCSMSHFTECCWSFVSCQINTQQLIQN